jgi:hypothetical protein
MYRLLTDCASRREYVEALEKEMQHKRQQVTLATMITEAKAEVGRFSMLYAGPPLILYA